MAELTVERLFGDPPLTGTLPASLQLSPDGATVAYVRLAEDDRERMDLWRYRVAEDRHECWVNAAELLEQAGSLSDAEKAERERRRQFSRGITRYSFSTDGSHVLLPVDGAGYLLETATGALRRFTPPGTRQTDLTFSPRGGFVSYVRAGDLYVHQIRPGAGTETRLTSDGGGTVSNGIADFIAQEEMHRFEGHWWSPDERYLAYTRVDEEAVDLSYRYEIDAEQIQVIPQRYPYAGARNADVQLMVWDRQTGKAQAVAYRAVEDDYLARVSWLGGTLIVQRQSRDQKLLTLLRYDPRTGSSDTLLTETADTWVNLHDNFKALEDGRFLWTSERSGSSHLYVYETGQLRAVTEGSGRVNRIAAAGDGSAWILGWFERPTEQQLYRVPLEGGTPVPVTTEPGWHEVSVSTDRRWLLDRFTALDHPGRVRLVPLQTTGQRSGDAGGRDTGTDAGAGSDPSRIIAEENIAPDHPYFPYREDHVTPELGTITAQDGQSLHFRLTRPPAPRPEGGHPVIVSVYGGPGVHRVKNEWPPLLLQLLARHGYGVLELDNRGSSNRERGFETPIFGRLGDVEVRDQLAGARFLQSQAWVNPERIGVFGHSYGGYMAIMCLAKAAGTFRAGVAVAPVTDWRLYDTHYTERYLSTPTHNPDGYEASSVFPHLDGLTGKLLLIHGMADDNVLYTHSTKLYRALQARNIPFEMMAYPGAKHALQERDVSVHRFNLLLDFFRRNL